jgi:hypothetical protein
MKARAAVALLPVLAVGSAGCATTRDSAANAVIVRGEILEMGHGINLVAMEPGYVYMVRVGYRTPDGIYEQRPFILNRQSFVILGLEGAAEACVDVTAKWHVLVRCS